MLRLALYSLLASALVFCSTSAANLGKNYVGSPEYPNVAAWDGLRQATGGRLQKCPGATTGAGCGATNTKADYALLASSAQDVAAAMKFANKYNLRVTVRNTGHDFMARHSGHGSLAILTRNLKGSSWTAAWTPGAGTADFVKRQVGAKQAAVAINAGCTWSEVISVVKRHNHAVVHGADSSVGASGGWTQGGGHGPYSVTQGLGCDNALEFQVVTPTGDIVIANEVSHPDLYMALRGGGGSTYGVVTRTIMRTFPSPNMPSMLLRISGGAKGRSGYLDAMAYFIAMTPNITDFGMGGYPQMSGSSYTGQMSAPGKSAAAMNAFFNPIAAKMRALGASVSATPLGLKRRSDSDGTERIFPDPVVEHYRAKQNATEHAKRQNGNMNLTPIHNTPVADISSRLLARSALNEANIPAIRKMLGVISSAGTILPYPVAGGQVARNRNLKTGVNPAWRDSVMHLEILSKNIAPMIAAMDPLSADHGAYWNEADGKERDWKRAFFGPPAHYEKLLAVKRKYDPKNVLWCMPCVGGDAFVEGQDGKLYLPGSAGPAKNEGPVPVAEGPNDEESESKTLSVLPDNETASI